MAPVALKRVDPIHKILLDDGTAEDADDARRILEGYKLQIDIGEDVVGNPAHEAALLTILNTARRAFLGGVHVHARSNPTMRSKWAAGSRLSEVIERYGATEARTLSPDHPTVIVGKPPERFPTSGICLTATHRGWSAGVLASPGMSLPSGWTFMPAAVASGAIVVSEAFQHVRGREARAGRRDVGLSLWHPDADWRTPEWGPERDLLFPAPLHLVGLGHLGQAALWTLGLLDFAEAPLLYLQDDDLASEENEATSLLMDTADRGTLKTRLCASRMEALGFRTRLIERRLTDHDRSSARDARVLLAGFDNPAARALLSGTGFDLIVDLGIGAGHRDYLDMRMYSFPASRTSEELFPVHGADAVSDELLEQPAWRKLHQETGDRCGVIEIAGQAVGAAFVGALTAAIGVAELVRYYVDDRRYELIDVSLRNLSGATAVPVRGFEGAENLGYVTLG